MYAAREERSSSPFLWDGRDEYRGATAVSLLGALAFVALWRFGLPQADLHSPLHFAGVMDPLCGMTRAMYALTRVDLAAAWTYNPGAFALVAFGVFFTFRAALATATGRWLTWTAPPRRLTWAGVGFVVVLLWINQQANADLLMTTAVP